MMDSVKVLDMATSTGRSYDRYRRIIITAISGGAARGISVITGLISVPITVNYLGKERFGLWMTISSSIALLQFADLGIGNGLMNKISEAKGRDDWDRIRVLVSNGTFVLWTIALFLLFIFFILNNIVSWPRIFNIVNPTTIDEAGPTVAVCFITLALNIALSGVIRINMAFQDGHLNGIWQSIGSVIGLLALLAAVRLRVGLPALVAVYISGPLIATFANGVWLYRRNPWTRPSINIVDAKVIHNIAALGGWFLCFQVVYLFNNAIPNLVISHMLGLNKVAPFAVAMKLASVMVILQSVILAPLWPAYAEARTRGDWAWVKNTLHRSLWISGTIGLVAAAILVIFGVSIIKLWVGQEMVVSYGLLIGFGAWILLSSIYGPVTMFLNGMGVIRIQALSGIVFSAVLLCGCIVMAKWFGLTGISLAFGVVYLLPAIIVGWWVIRKILLEEAHRGKI